VGKKILSGQVKPGNFILSREKIGILKKSQEELKQFRQFNIEGGRNKYLNDIVT